LLLFGSAGSAAANLLRRFSARRLDFDLRQPARLGRGVAMSGFPFADCFPALYFASRRTRGCGMAAGNGAIFLTLQRTPK